MEAESSFRAGTFLCVGGWFMLAVDRVPCIANASTKEEVTCSRRAYFDCADSVAASDLCSLESGLREYMCVLGNTSDWLVKYDIDRTRRGESLVGTPELTDILQRSTITYRFGIAPVAIEELLSLRM